MLSEFGYVELPALKRLLLSWYFWLFCSYVSLFSFSSRQRKAWGGRITVRTKVLVTVPIIYEIVAGEYTPGKSVEQRVTSRPTY